MKLSRVIFLIRHGESSGNSNGTIQGWTDTALTELGRRQAALLGQRLADEGSVARVLSSPLARALETAEIVAATLGLRVDHDPRLREYGYGALEGLTRAEAGRRYPGVAKAWVVNGRWNPVDGEEGTEAFGCRVREALSDSMTHWTHDGDLAIVAHGGSLDICLRALLSVERPSFRCFTFSNASLTRVRIAQGPGGELLPRVITLDDTRHLG